MDRSDRGLLASIEQFAREQCAGHDPAHDALHLERVAGNAVRILDQRGPDTLGADRFATLAACWLHDLVQTPKAAGPPGEAARRSAELAASFLSRLRLGEHRRELIVQAVAAHSFSGGVAPPSLEAAILQDADRLDALGAVGIARLWITAATLNSQLYDPAVPAADRRPLDDARFAIDHIASKLLRLPETMHTAAGRRLALERARIVAVYHEQFLREIQASDADS